MSFLSKGLAAAAAAFVLQGCVVVPARPMPPPGAVYVQPQSGMTQATTPRGYVREQLGESSCPKGTVEYAPNIRTASAAEVRNFNGYISYISNNSGQRHDVCLSPEQLKAVKAGKSLTEVMVPAPASIQPVPIYVQPRRVVRDSYYLGGRVTNRGRSYRDNRYYFDPYHDQVIKKGGHHDRLWNDRRYR